MHWVARCTIPVAMGRSGGRQHVVSMETAEVRTAMDALRRIVRALRVSARAAEKHLGISAPQLFVLHQLADHAGLSIGELARRAVTDQSSVSVVVSRLTTRGLAVRRTSMRDGRRAEV